MSRLLAPLAAVLALAVILMAGAAPALAHKMKLFATAEGPVISGYVYFPGGGRGAGLEVTVTAPDGTALGTVTTDAEGAFHFEATQGVDHRFVARSLDGHLAEFTVPASQLPPGLSGGAAPGGAGSAAPAEAGETPEASAPAPAVDMAALEETIARAVAREVNPLREQIEGYEERVRLHDILGGMGWIAGLAGLGFFVLGRRRGG